MQPTVYFFDAVSGVYSGNGLADADQLAEGEYLIPAFATLIAPPDVGSNETARWTGNAWELVPDYRGQTYWLDDGSQHRVRDAGEPLPPGALLEPPLSRLKADACLKIDIAAEAARMQFITPGEGQAWTYQRKEREAEAFMADVNPDAADYPVLAACIPGDGADLAAVAQTVLAARDAWLQVGAAIEGIRRAAKTQVEAAIDAAAIQTILDGLNWPAPN